MSDGWKPTYIARETVVRMIGDAEKINVLVWQSVARPAEASREHMLHVAETGCMALAPNFMAEDGFGLCFRDAEIDAMVYVATINGPPKEDSDAQSNRP